MEPQLRLTVLGPLQAHVGGASLPLGGTKQRAVLAALAIAHGRVVSADSLAAAAWNDEPPAAFSASLQVFISNIRRGLREAGVDAHATLVTAQPGYRLIQAGSESDLGRFEALTRTARESFAAGRLADASGQFRAALDEFTGDPLSDLRGLRFANEFAAAVAEHRLVVFGNWIDVELSCGRAAAVLSELAVAAQAEPLREPLWAQLITALYLAGRQSDALDAYRRLRVVLADQLGIDPSPLLRDLEGVILRQEPLKSAAPAASMAETITFTASPAGRAALRDEAGRMIPIAAAGLHIGRMADNDVVLEDAGVSRYHASVIDTGSGVVLRDLRSANGTMVGGQRVFDSAVLADGVEIRIGPATFTFHLAD